jgi:hypothetical protein
VTDHPLQLDVTRSGFFEDKLRVVFHESLKYFETETGFGSAPKAFCVDRFTWTTERQPNCTRRWVGDLDWAVAYNPSSGGNDCRLVTGARES